jgi:hypothetical protein
MKFTVSKTSDYNPSPKRKPLENSVWESYTNRLDLLNLPEEGWVIDVISLEDLMNLLREDGVPSLVVTHYEENSMPNIEVYDDYRE